VIKLSEKEFFMSRAIKLAKLGWGKTNPNPLVGAVVVKDGKIIAEGYHKQLGGPHAEVEAFKQRKGGRCRRHFVCQFGAMFPLRQDAALCSKNIDVGIKKVVAAIKDPNPKVSGRGFEMLKNAGIEVEVGVLEEEAIRLNEIFITYIVKKNLL